MPRHQCTCDKITVVRTCCATSNSVPLRAHTCWRKLKLEVRVYGGGGGLRCTYNATGQAPPATQLAAGMEVSRDAIHAAMVLPATAIKASTTMPYTRRVRHTPPRKLPVAVAKRQKWWSFARQHSRLNAVDT